MAANVSLPIFLHEGYRFVKWTNGFTYITYIHSHTVVRTRHFIGSDIAEFLFGPSQSFSCYQTNVC